MNEREFMDAIDGIRILDAPVKTIEKAYGIELSQEAKHILSFAPTGGFVGDWRILSTRAIVSASDEMDFDFIKAGLVPIFDIMDGDYVVYHAATQLWSMFSLTDEIAFNEDKPLRELLPG